MKFAHQLSAFEAKACAFPVFHQNIKNNSKEGFKDGGYRPISLLKKGIEATPQLIETMERA